jgi:hypothetical protein
MELVAKCLIGDDLMNLLFKYKQNTQQYFLCVYSDKYCVVFAHSVLSLKFLFKNYIYKTVMFHGLYWRFFMIITLHEKMGKKTATLCYFHFQIYLTSQINTKCSKTCRTDMIKNGICDKVCNYDHCAWDGGDCRYVPDHLRPRDGDNAHCDFAISVFYTNAIFNKIFGQDTRRPIAHVPLFIDKQVNTNMVEM